MEVFFRKIMYIRQYKSQFNIHVMVLIKHQYLKSESIFSFFSSSMASTITFCFINSLMDKKWETCLVLSYPSVFCYILHDTIQVVRLAAELTWSFVGDRAPSSVPEPSVGNFLFLGDLGPRLYGSIEPAISSVPLHTH